MGRFNPGLLAQHNLLALILDLQACSHHAWVLSLLVCVRTRAARSVGGVYVRTTLEGQADWRDNRPCTG